MEGSSKSELLVWGTTKQHEEFASLLEGLDAPPPASAATLPRSYPLAVQESAVAVQLLSVEFPDAKITASIDGKQITVLADESLHAKIAERIELFNTQLTKRPELILQSYSVRGFTAVGLQTTLTPLLTTARVNLDVEHSRVLVTADANTHAEIAKLVQALGEEAGVDQQKVVVAYPVNHASPTQLKTVLDQLVTGSTIIADEKLRQLVVTGTLAQQTTIRTTLEQIDRRADAKGPVNIQSFETKKLQAVVLLPALQKLWPTMELTADATANRILASGTETELAQLGSAIDRLISAPDGKQQVVKTYPVPAGEMTTLATILGQIAPQAIVSSDPVSRTVTVWASDEQQLRVQQALEQISKTAADAKVPATYIVKPTQVIAVQTSLQTLFPSVGVSSIPVTGQLIVVAAPETQKRIAEVIELLATGPNAAENTVRVFRIDPDRIQFSAMLTALQATLPSQIRIEPNAANSTLLVIGTPAELDVVADKVKLLEQQLPQPDQRSSVVYPLQHGNTVSAITILQTLVPKATLAQDPLNKTIAATATADEQQQIAEFLKAFDVPKKTNLETRVYRLKKGSARGFTSCPQ